MARFVTPFMKQAYVTSGVSLNVCQIGIVTGYVMGIVPQLQEPGSPIYMDDEMASWFASVHGFALIIGNLAVASIMGTYGRWAANVLSSCLSFIGWIFIALANNVTWLIIGRIVQGIHLGLILSTGPIMIGEYTSPRHRGMFLTALTSILSLSTLLVHVASSYLYWRVTALLCTIVSFVTLIINMHSPETPSFLADKGRYDDCKKVFRWLRGNNEEDELEKLIEAASAARKSKPCTREHETINAIIKYRLIQMKTIIMKKEVYKPLIVTIHLSVLVYWSGLNIITAYPDYIISDIVGKQVNIPSVLISIDVLGFIVSTVSMYIVTKFKRKTILLVAVGLNIASYFLVAAYAYAKSNNWLPFNQPIIGIILLHAQMFFVTAGALPLPLIISGEVYPLKYRSISSVITNIVSSVHFFLLIKTFTALVRNVKIHGACAVYGLVCAYSLFVSYIYLPETKDKTLQEIEDEFKGETPSRGAEESAQFLRNSSNKDTVDPSDS